MKINPKLLKIIKNQPIGKKLLELEPKRFDNLGFELVDGAPRFTVMPLAEKKVTTKSTVIRLGAFITRNIPGFSENEIRLFNEFVVAKIKENDYTLSVISGESIRWAYNINNYVSKSLVNLRGSCMAAASLQMYIDFYAYNPETIQMLVCKILGKVAGRALLFRAFQTLEDVKANKNPVKLLGRKYVSTTEVNTLMNSWASSNVDFLLERDYSRVANAPGAISLRRQFFIKPEISEFNYYPYADHFLYLNPDTGIYSVQKPSGKFHVIGTTITTSGGSSVVTSYLDKFRPDQVFLWEDRKWAPKVDCVERPKMGWVLKSKFSLCQKCNELIPKQQLVTLIDKKVVCGRHATSIPSLKGYVLLEDAARCRACLHHFLKKDINKNRVCKTCFETKKQCVYCKRYHKDVFSIGRKNHCKTCMTSLGYMLCKVCNKVKPTAHAQDAKCYPKPTYEKLISDGTSKISKSALKITI
jgi:hypothetical protein